MPETSYPNEEQRESIVSKEFGNGENQFGSFTEMELFLCRRIFSLVTRIKAIESTIPGTTDPVADGVSPWTIL